MKTTQKNIKDHRRLISLILILAVFTLITACKKFVQIPPPQTLLVTTNVFANNATASSALTVIYTQMNVTDIINISQWPGLAADELTNYSTGVSQIQSYTNSLSVASGPANGDWINAYKYIYQANAIITGLQQNTGVSPSVKQQLTGEAKFLRAFWHFYLTDFFGDVPLVLTTDYTVTDKLARTPRVQVLQQVIADLTDAQNALNNNYVDASDTITTTERVQPNKAAATALLARAYLYLGDYNNHDAAQYANAEAQSSSVISNSLYSLSPLTGSTSVFKKNSTETIWSLQTNLPTANYATSEGKGYILISAPGGGVSNAISPQLFNSFEAGDQRKINWIGSYTTTTLPAVTYYFPYKYKDQNVTVASEYSVVLRLGEQYLIRAEAEAQEGKTNPAITDLNIIRNRAGLANYAGATDKASLLAAILHERQVELFTEWGHRWFDLARTGTINSVMGSPGNVYQFKNGGVGTWNPNWQLFPIPNSDIARDPNLTQTPGY